MTIPASASRRLHEAVVAVCPISGVRVVDWSDRSTWEVLAEPGVTHDQLRAAASVLRTFDPMAEPPPDVIDENAAPPELLDIITELSKQLLELKAETMRLKSASETSSTRWENLTAYVDQEVKRRGSA
jgi:hypothetical protein